MYSAARVPAKRRARLGDVMSDTYSPTVPDLSIAIDTPAPPPDVSVASDSGGWNFSDILNAITGTAQAATQVYSAVDLININKQRAGYGLPPVNQYGQVGTSATTRASIGISWPLILGGLGLVALVALRK